MIVKDAIKKKQNKKQGYMKRCQRSFSRMKKPSTQTSSGLSAPDTRFQVPRPYIRSLSFLRNRKKYSWEP